MLITVDTLFIILSVQNHKGIKILWVRFHVFIWWYDISVFFIKNGCLGFGINSNLLSYILYQFYSYKYLLCNLVYLVLLNTHHQVEVLKNYLIIKTNQYLLFSSRNLEIMLWYSPFSSHNNILPFYIYHLFYELLYVNWYSIFWFFWFEVIFFPFG